MKRILVTASHHKMADGLKDTLNFVSGGVQETIALSAYLDNQPVEEAVDELMKGFAEEDEVIVLTDLTSGSVNQQFFRYRNRPHTHIVSGMNLPLALTTVLMKDNMDKEMLPQAVLGEAHEALKEFKLASDDDDEEDDI